MLKPGVILVLLAILGSTRGTDAISVPDSARAQVVDDFERDRPGEWPSRWRFLSSREQEFLPLDAFMKEHEQFVVMEEKGNRFLRAYTRGEAQRISLPDDVVRWDLTTHPRLSWRWRALQLPHGAREDKVNDSGGAVYVSFAKKDWLGRPLSIKYVYSTILPVGTVVSTGNVKILVAASGVDGIGRWVQVERDVVADYRRLFGADPPQDPFTITLWSDSDNTRSVAEVDFDDIVLLPAR